MWELACMWARDSRVGQRELRTLSLGAKTERGCDCVLVYLYIYIDHLFRPLQLIVWFLVLVTSKEGCGWAGLVIIVHHYNFYTFLQRKLRNINVILCNIATFFKL